MRKKLLIVWIIIIAGLFAWTSLRRQEQDAKKRAKKAQQESQKEVETKKDDSPPFPTTSSDDAEASVKAQAITNLKEHPAYADVRNYSLNDDQLIEKWKGKEKELAQFLIQSANETAECIKKDLCGEKPDPNSPYFDKDNTPSHELLSRELGALIRMREDGLLEYDQIPASQMESMLDIKNESIQSMAFEMRLAAGIDDDAYNRLLARTPSLLPKASASSLSQLNHESRSSQARRDELIKTAEALLRSDNQMQAVEMAKRVKYLGTDKAELERLTKSSCGLLPQNQKTVQYYLSAAAEGVGTTLNFECP